MGHTLTEKIIAKKCDRETVRAGDFINAQVDLVLVSDLLGVMAVDEFEKINKTDLFDPQKVVFTLDHNALSMDYESLGLMRNFRDFANKFGIKYFDASQSGTPLLFLPNLGLVFPGDLVIGSDPHTCSFGFLGAIGLGVGSTDIAAAMALGELWLQVPESVKVVFNGDLPKWVTGKDLALYLLGQIGEAGALNRVIEFSGEVIENLDLSDRYTIANLVIEAGAEAGVFPSDKIVQDFSRGHNPKFQDFLTADSNADYAIEHEIYVSELEPLVSMPHIPYNVVPLSGVGEIEIDRVVIGSAASGTLEVLQASARVLEGRKVHPRVRTVVIPGTQRIYLEALHQGLIEIFLQANCIIGSLTNGGCIGNHYGILGEGERCITTGNQNYKGLMGHPKSEIYIASAYVAATSAVVGKITSPSEILG
jgi:3-isopropylmalate/(R)-2-methylmalate dehydratase large subunit